MDPLDIDRALVTSLQALALPYPINWEGTPADPSDTAVYCDVANIPGRAMPVTLGTGGEDEHVGVFQIDVVEPVVSGGNVTDSIIKQLYQYYVLGRGFTYNGVVVQVTGFQRSSRRKDTNGARNRVAASIFWRANLNRSIF